jgi:hypothetical protein
MNTDKEFEMKTKVIEALGEWIINELKKTPDGWTNDLLPEMINSFANLTGEVALNRNLGMPE